MVSEQELNIENIDINLLLSFLLTQLNTENISNIQLNLTVNEDINSLMTEFNSNTSIGLPFTRKLKKSLSKLPKNNEFVFIGLKTLELNEADNYIEVYFGQECSSENCEEITFIFNDVTKTRIREQQNAEVKYKTLFLSKVAHELKNPLICICELVSHLAERESFQNSEDLKTIYQIRAMSNFLLVLVKDLNYFAESQLGNETPLEVKR